MRIQLCIIYIGVMHIFAAQAMLVSGFGDHVARMRAARKKVELQRGKCVFCVPECDREKRLRAQLKKLNEQAMQAEVMHMRTIRRQAREAGDPCLGCPKEDQIRLKYASQGIQVTQELINLLNKRLVRWQQKKKLMEENELESARGLATQINGLSEEIEGLVMEKEAYTDKQRHLMELW